MRKSEKPKITARPTGVAETSNERVIQVTFPDGKEAKISFFSNPEGGAASIFIYDSAPGIAIYAAGSLGTVITGS